MQDSPQDSQAAPERVSPGPVLRRTAARVVFVDLDASVLLLSGRDPSVAGAPEFWFTPGGGAEPGESLESAASREVYEEVGYHVEELGPVVWERSSTFEFDGVSFAQEESFFVVRTTRFEARRVAWTDFESRSVTGWRWWSVAALQRPEFVVYPPRLGMLVERWLHGGSPVRPERID